jgi:hypothetical protein
MLAELPAEYQEATYAEARERRANALVPIESTIQHRSRQLEATRRVNQMRRQAEDEGVRVVDPAKEFGSTWYQHRLDTDAESNEQLRGGLPCSGSTCSMVFTVRLTRFTGPFGWSPRYDEAASIVRGPCDVATSCGTCPVRERCGVLPCR